MIKHLLHCLPHRLWYIPGELVILLHEPQQVAARGVSLCTTELLASMEDAEVVQELDVARLELKLQTQFLGNLGHDLERLLLMGRQRAQQSVAWVARSAEEGTDTVVADHLASMLE